MSENNLRETGSVLMLDFTKIKEAAQKSSRDIMVVVIQDVDTLQVLITAYIDAETFDLSLKDDLVTLWTTSRNKLWRKGDTSGDFLELIEARPNCDQNSLLFLVRPVKGGACHVKDANGNTYKTCYSRRIIADADGLGLKVVKEAMQKKAGGFSLSSAIGRWLGGLSRAFLRM
jgi:phosphoribosyl-AMP cyclohydrolase